VHKTIYLSALTGVVYMNSCPIQPFIPLWVLVYGSVASGQLVLSIFKWCFCRKKDDESDTRECFRKIVSAIETLIVLSLIGWLIAGSYWVFVNFGGFEFSGSCSILDSDCCQSVIYWFAFGSLLTIYLFLLLICCFCFTYCLFALFK